MPFSRETELWEFADFHVAVIWNNNYLNYSIIQNSSSKRRVVTSSLTLVGKHLKESEIRIEIGVLCNTIDPAITFIHSFILSWFYLLQLWLMFKKNWIHPDHFRKIWIFLPLVTNGGLTLFSFKPCYVCTAWLVNMRAVVWNIARTLLKQMENSLRLSHCIKWPWRGWKPCYLFTFLMCLCLCRCVCQVFSFCSSLCVVSDCLCAYIWGCIPQCVSFAFNKSPPVRPIECLNIQQNTAQRAYESKESNPKRTPYRKNAKLSTLNHHKLLCFKYYLYLWRFPLSISSASLFISASLFYTYIVACCYSKSNFAAQFNIVHLKNACKICYTKHSMPKTLTPHTYTNTSSELKHRHLWAL